MWFRNFELFWTEASESNFFLFFIPTEKNFFLLYKNGYCANRLHKNFPELKIYGDCLYSEKSSRKNFSNWRRCVKVTSTYENKNVIQLCSKSETIWRLENPYRQQWKFINKKPKSLLALTIQNSWVFTGIKKWRCSVRRRAWIQKACDEKCPRATQRSNHLRDFWSKSIFPNFFPSYLHNHVVLGRKNSWKKTTSYKTLAGRAAFKTAKRHVYWITCWQMV